VTLDETTPDGESIAGRLEASAGTTLAAALGSSVGPYRDWAVVPKGPWRNLTRDELVRLTAPTDSERAADVRIVRISRHLTERLHAGLGDTTHAREETGLQCVLGSQELTACLADLERAVEPFGQVTKKPLIRINRPGLLTTTVDDEGMYIGLHVDNWYHYTLEDRRASPNRICVNVGRESRYLLLVNVPMANMFAMLREAPVNELHPEMVGTPLGLAFMLGYPDYPVLRFRIEPGEGYLAPTENLVHDASTVGMRSWDLAVHVLGRFFT
jgi:hypothetical protein